MRSKADGEKQIMIGQTEWYGQAGKRPFPEDGFTPALMTRIEQAADFKSAGRRRFRIKKQFAITAIATLLLIGTIVLPFEDWKNAGPFASPSGQSLGAALLPAVSPPATDQSYNPPVGSALFEFSGKKYYMPLTIDRNKLSASAVETSAGIVWSPPPPMVDYTKKGYTRPTEPRSLYLTSKGQTELSVSSATRLYTFPLYAGGASTYYVLGGIIGAGDYVLMPTSKYTLGIGGSEKYFDGKYSTINVKEALAGETVIPKELFSDVTQKSSKKGLFAFDKELDQLLILNYVDNGDGGNNTTVDRIDRYDLENSSILKPATITELSEIKAETRTMTYKVDGELRKADIIAMFGHPKRWGIDLFPSR